MDAKLHVGFLNFNNKLGKSFTNSESITCNILFRSKAGYSIGIKFFPHDLNTTGTTHVGFNRQIHQIKVTSKDVNISLSNEFPAREVISGTFLNINYEIRKLPNTTGGLSIHMFEILFYTFHFLNNEGNKCLENDTICINSSRCLPEPMTCINTFDFCANGFKNCQPVTFMPNETTKTIYSVSYNGVYIFMGCFVALLFIMLYMCFCRTVVAYCKHSRKCSFSTYELHTPIVERPRDRQEPEVQETADNDGIISNQIEANVDDNPDNDSNETRSVQFGLPPSYSYLEKNMALEEQQETCLSDKTSSTTSLPPSYSTVLTHEQDFNVHVY